MAEKQRIVIKKEEHKSKQRTLRDKDASYSESEVLKLMHQLTVPSEELDEPTEDVAFSECDDEPKRQTGSFNSPPEKIDKFSEELKKDKQNVFEESDSCCEELDKLEKSETVFGSSLSTKLAFENKDKSVFSKESDVLPAYVNKSEDSNVELKDEKHTHDEEPIGSNGSPVQKELEIENLDIVVRGQSVKSVEQFSEKKECMSSIPKELDETDNENKAEKTSQDSSLEALPSSENEQETSISGGKIEFGEIAVTGKKHDAEMASEICESDAEISEQVSFHSFVSDNQSKESLAECSEIIPEEDPRSTDFKEVFDDCRETNLTQEERDHTGLVEDKVSSQEKSTYSGDGLVSSENCEDIQGNEKHSSGEVSAKESENNEGQDKKVPLGTNISNEESQEEISIDKPNKKIPTESSISVDTAEVFSSQEMDSCNGGLLSSAKVWAITPEVINEELLHVKPMALSELCSLYPNQQLTLNQKYVEKFLRTIEQHEKQDFYELVQKYYSSCNKLFDIKQDINVHMTELSKIEGKVWGTKEYSATGCGECSDKAKVEARIQYENEVYSSENASVLGENLKNVRSLIHDPFIILSYEKHFSELHVEAYLSDLYKRHPEWHELSSGARVVAHLDVTPYEVESASLLKNSLSVLFAFQRKPVKDATFTEVTQNWIRKLVAILLRVGTLEDHLYILNQVLRCPAGIATWAVQYVQVFPPPICINSMELFGHPLIDHYVNQLAMLLMPIKDRKKLLYQLQRSVSEVTSGTTWTILDTDGEEEYDPLNSWYYLEENDLIALLNQLPLSSVMKHMLFNVDASSGKITYRPECSFVEGNVTKLIAFATALVNILGDSLQVFGIPRYKQFHRRLVTMMRSILCFVSEHLANCQNFVATLSKSTQQKLQVEFDNLFFRVVSAFTSASGFSSWQYLTELPFVQLSETNIWKVLWKIYFLQESEFSPSESLCSDEFCKQLYNFDKLHCLHEKLLTLEASAVLHLLGTFSSMACSRSAYSLFVQTVVTEVYNLGYIDTRTREFCCRQGREVLSLICKNHPQAMSDVFKSTCNNLSCMGKVAVFLYGGLPLWMWKPTADEFDILGKWLVSCGPDSVENLLARTILEGLNWGTDSYTGQLFIRKQFHFCIMQVIIEAYKKHLPSHILSNILTDKFCKTKAWKGTKDSKDLMALFLWKLALQLDLFCSDGDISIISISEFCMEKHMEREKTSKIVEYFSLVGGRCGRTAENFCVDGINHLEALAEKPYALPALHALSLVLTRMQHPEQIQCLVANQKFINILEKLLAFDDTNSQLFASEFPGPVRQLVCALIEKHVSHREEYSWTVEVGKFWLHTITKLTDWNLSRGVLYILNRLLMVTFRVPEFMDVSMKHFSELYKNHQMADHSEGILSSVVTWLSRGSTGNNFPPLLQESFCWDFPYLMYSMLTVESLWENENSLWTCMSELLHKNPDIGLDSAFLSKVLKSLNISKGPSFENLSIFRWAQLLVSTDFSCFILPLICQKFFLLYLGRPQSRNIPTRSVGRKVFAQGQRATTLEKVTQKMTAAAETYQKLAMNDTAKQTTQALEKHIQDKNLHQDLTRFYRATVYWLSEPLLHEDVVSVSDLPFHFEKDRLFSMIERDQNLWYDLVKWSGLNEEMQKMATDWKDTFSQSEFPQDRKPNIIHKTATQKLLQRLNYDDVTEPPPDPAPFVSPYADLPLALLQDKERLEYVVKADLEFIAKQANRYYISTTEKENLDYQYLQLLPRLFKPCAGEKKAVVACTSMINPLHRCKGPASIFISFEGTVRDEIVNHKVIENREKLRLLENTGLMAPSLDICGSFCNIENIVGELTKQYRLSRNGALESSFEKSGHCLYFVLTSYMNKFTKYFPATRHFFTSCLEKLGPEFVIGKPLQTRTLLKTLLTNKYLLDMISHHFLPNCNPECFIQMYQDVTSHFMEDEYEVTVTLLTKFKVKQWLAHKSVGIAQTRSLLDVTVDILSEFGKRPAKQITLLCELCRCTLVELMEFRFPQLYGDVLQALLDGGSSGKLMPVVWNDFVFSLVSDQAENQGAARINLLSFSQIKESIDVVSKHFHMLRLKSSDSAGIYPKWRAYITPLCSYIEHICKSFVHWRIKWLETANHDSATIVELWNILEELFEPWTGCYTNQSDVLFPWVEADKEPASSVVRVFAECVGLLHDKLQPLQLDIFPLNLIWKWYIQNICKAGVPSYVQYVVQEQMSLLPWMQFQPTIDDLMSLTGELERKNKTSCDFMISILCCVPWTDICQAGLTNKSEEDSLESRTAYFTRLFHIFVMLPSYIIDKKEDVARLLMSVEMCDWEMMDVDTFQHTAQYFTSSCDTSCKFIQRSQPHAVGLRLLKKASGMFLQDGTHLKQCLPKLTFYVRSIAQIVLKLSEDNTVERDQLKAILMNILTELEGVAALGKDDKQWASPLCVELLAVFNMCANKKLLLIKDVVFEWIAHSPRSPLLLPLLNAGSRTIVNISCMVQLSEACIDGYFFPEIPGDVCWPEVLKNLKVPELNLPDFIEESLACGAFLTLYAHSLQMLTSSNTRETEISCLCNLVEWHRGVKSILTKEHKLILWWWKILALSDRQTDIGIEPEEVKTMLSDVVSSVWSLGEDRESEGLFGTLGLGKKSTFAVKFRVICKVLAMCIKAVLEEGNWISEKSKGTGTQVSDATKTADIKKVTSQYAAHVEQLLLNSNYGEYRSQLEAGLQFVQNSDKTLTSVVLLLKSLVIQLYPNETFFIDLYGQSK